MPPRALPRRRPPSLNLVLCGAPEKRPGPARAPSGRGARGGPGHSPSPAAQAGVTPVQAPQAACERGWTKATPGKCMIVQQLLPARATLRGQGPGGAAALRQKELCGHSPECGARGARPRRGQRRGAAPQAGGCASSGLRLKPAAPPAAGGHLPGRSLRGRRRPSRPPRLLGAAATAPGCPQRAAPAGAAPGGPD